MALYKLFVPGQTAGASAIHWDLFNAGSNGCDLTLLSVVPIPSGAVAVTGVVAVDIYLTRTTAIGTSGTAATFEGSSLTAATICAYDNDQPLVASLGISARLTPTGGATAGAVLAFRSVFTEETNSGAYTQYADMVRGWHEDRGVPVKAGTGVRVIQSSVASVGVVAYEVLFDVTRR
jgi:hypothetical protein